MLQSVRLRPEPAFETRYDDFSVQLSLESDPMFWVRALNPRGAELVVTDFKRSQATTAMMAEALVVLASTSPVPADICRLRFLDLVPSSHGLPGAKAQAEAEAAHIVKVVVAYAVGRSSEIASVQLRSRDVKFDLDIDLVPFTE